VYSLAADGLIGNVGYQLTDLRVMTTSLGKGAEVLELRDPTSKPKPLNSLSLSLSLSQ